MIRPREHLENMYREGQPFFSRFEVMRCGYNEYSPYAKSELYDKLLKTLNYDIISAYPSVNDAYIAISRFIGQPVERIMLTSGSDGGIFNTFMTFCNPGDKVVLLKPNYGMYYVYADLMNCDVDIIECKLDYRTVENKILESINDEVKIIAIANPNGYSGKEFDKGFLDKVIKKANKTGTIVLLDEVYADFCDYGKSKYMSYIDDYDNLIILRSFSKSYGVAGIRAGYLVCNEKTCYYLKRVRQNVEINAVAVEVIKIWCNERKLLKECIDDINISKQYFEKKIKELGLEIFVGNANFCLLKIGDKNIDSFRKHMEDNFVELKYVQDIFPGCVRITIGTKEYMKKVINLIEEYKQNVYRD